MRRIALLLALSAAGAQGAVTYSTFNYPDAAGGGTYLTGIRSFGGSDVLMTGVYEPASGTQGLIYVGPLDSNTGSWHVLNASIPGQTVTSTALYGPNTLSAGNIRAVGSYKIEGSALDHGLLYEGAADGSGIYRNLDVPDAVAGGAVLNTIAHSTHGSLVVGNYDTSLAAGKAFIYDLDSSAFFDLAKDGAVSITAYGIWHNGGTSYTIAGGFAGLESDEAGYLVDYDSVTHELTHWTVYNYNNSDALVTHFDGITTDGAGGYYLTGDWLGAGEGAGQFGFFTHVTRNMDGSFLADPEWTSIAFEGVPDVNVTSGNSVLGTQVIGIYIADGDGTAQGYVASVAVPEPEAFPLVVLCGLGALLAVRKIRTPRRGCSQLSGIASPRMRSSQV